MMLPIFFENPGDLFLGEASRAVDFDSVYNALFSPAFKSADGYDKEISCFFSGEEFCLDDHLIPNVCFICFNSSSCLLTNLGIVFFLLFSSAHQRSWHFFGLRQNLCQERVFFNLAPHQSHFSLLEVLFMISQLYAYPCIPCVFWTKE